MEHLPEETAANETEERCKIRGNPIETEDYSLHNVSMSLPESVTTYPVLDERDTVKELTVTNYESPSSCDIGCSSKNVIISKSRYLYQLPENSQKSRMPLIFGNAEDSSSKDKHVGSSTIPTLTSNKEHFVDSRSKTLVSSGFTQFFLGKSHKSVSHKSRQSHSSEETSSSLSKESSFSHQFHSHNIVRGEGLKLPDSGINLREWIECMGPNVRKMNKLLLFRKIVEKVDIAHARGMALVELKPSFFTLLPTGDVKYIGPLMEFESLVVQENKKRGLEQEIFRGYSGRKKQNLGETHTKSLVFYDKSDHNVNNGNFDVKIEKKWYSCPEELEFIDLHSYNIYCLGLLLFELLCHFESIEEHSAAMLDLHNLILSPSFVSEHPKEAGFCLWLLHPEPCSRPTTRDILQSELFHGYEDANSSNDAAEKVDDAELDLLHHFLFLLKDHKQSMSSKLSESLEFLEADIKEIESKHASTKLSGENMLREKLFENFRQLEDAYFCMRSKSKVQVAEVPEVYRSDKDILRDGLSLSSFQTQNDLEQKSVDRVGTFFDGICKYARYKKFEVCGTLRNDDILNSNNVICSLSFDREEEYIAAAGASKKIKIFEICSLLNDSVDVHYPVLEMSNKSKLSCICWNNYIKNYLASTDYDGLVKMWDACTRQVIIEYKEHQQRAWSVDFSKVHPLKFASGSDDGSMRTWSINERNSTCTIWCPANVCCVQFSAFSSHLLAFGSADYKIYCYDVRHTRIPWCTLAGHGKAVSYVRFLDSDNIISASTDNMLKLWDLKKTCFEGLSLNACSLNFTGHSNEKNFVGLDALDGYIACGSETNEVYSYYRSLPMPITSHKFGSIDPISGHEINDNSNDHFVSSVCWRRKSEMVAAANSSGSIKLLRLV